MSYLAPVQTPFLHESLVFLPFHLRSDILSGFYCYGSILITSLIQISAVCYVTSQAQIYSSAFRPETPSIYVSPNSEI
jgi:hypothetical protein